MTFDLPFMVTTNTITVVIDGKTQTVESSNKKFEEIKEALKAKDEEKVRELIIFVHKLQKHADSNYLKGNIRVEGGLVLYKDVVIANAIVDRILKMQEEGFDIDPMIAFLNNLMENPSRTAVQELYLFLEGCSLPITSDGHFLAYKRVNEEYLDFHTRKMDNSVGKVLEIARNEVDDNRDHHCSYGLHFCSLAYLSQFNSGYGHIMILKINPKDVVSIPSDYNNTKGRTCRYEVIGEHELDERTEAFDSSVYDHNEDHDSEDYDNDDDDYGYDDDDYGEEDDTETLILTDEDEIDDEDHIYGTDDLPIADNDDRKDS